MRIEGVHDKVYHAKVFGGSLFTARDELYDMREDLAVVLWDNVRTVLGERVVERVYRE